MTPNFTLVEFTRSGTAARLGIDNTLPAELVPAARGTLAMLERIRAELCRLAGRDVPMAVSSGYRCAALNAAVGSRSTSDHLLAAAADWRADSFGTPYQIAQALAPLVGELGIGQLINEFPSKDGSSGWVHTSTRLPAAAVNRVITISKAGTVPGVVLA